MKKNKNFNLEAYITIIGVVVICFIIFTGIVSSIYILPILGAMCLMYGVFGLIRLKKDDSVQEGLLQRSLLQIVLGAFIIALGIIEALHLNLPDRFWNIFLVIIVIVIAFWFFIRHRSR